MPAPKNNIAEDKHKASLLPIDILIEMAEPAYREGLIKYMRESWRAGFKSSVMYDALMRHLNAYFYKYESYDPEALEKHNIKKHHLGAVIFCAINLYITEEQYPELDDRPLKIFKEYLDEHE